jgi:hypothetical protein
MRSRRLCAVCACLATAAFDANAVMLTFEGFSPFATADSAGDFIDTRGYRLINLEPRTTDGFQAIVPNAGAPNNRSAAIFNANDSSLALTTVNGSPFNLLALDFASRASGTGDNRSARFINVIGTASSGETVSFQTSALGDNFATAWLPTSFSGLTSVLFHPVVNQNSGILNYEFILDNISVSAVPLPAAVYLFGSGLLGLGGMAIRKSG